MTSRVAVVGATGATDRLTQAEPAQAPARVDWDTLMLRHGHRIVVSLLARGVRPERAKELAQEAWLRVIQAYRRGRLAELSVPGVVVAQAGFLALDDRRRARRRESNLPAFDDRNAVPAQALESRVVAREELRRIREVVKRAHPNAQRVFELLYGGGASSAAEVAAEVGLSVQRVRQISCELRQRIRRELGGADV